MCVRFTRNDVSELIVVLNALRHPVSQAVLFLRAQRVRCYRQISMLDSVCFACASSLSTCHYLARDDR